MTWWKSSYVKFLEAELERSRKDYELLLSTLLESAGHVSAAKLVRGPDAEAVSTPNLLERGKQVYDAKKEPSSGWRDMATRLSRATIPVRPKDSIEALEMRIEQEIT